MSFLRPSALDRVVRTLSETDVAFHRQQQQESDAIVYFSAHDVSLDQSKDDMAAASSALLADIANQLKKLDKLDLIEQELSKLTTEFSGMSQKVKDLELVQQDLVTGVSHQEEELSELQHEFRTLDAHVGRHNLAALHAKIEELENNQRKCNILILNVVEPGAQHDNNCLGTDTVTLSKGVLESC